MLSEALSAILGDITDNVYAMRLPDVPEYPAIVFQQVSGYRPVVHDGPMGIDVARVQVDSYDTTFEGAKELSEGVTSLNGHKETVDDTTIMIMIVDGEWDLYESGVDAYRATTDFRILYRVD
jgi:hypothetical protein